MAVNRHAEELQAIRGTHADDKEAGKGWGMTHTVIALASPVKRAWPLTICQQV